MKTKKRKNVIGLIAVLIVLILFPLISIVYLKKGIDFRKDMINATQPKGVLPPLSLFIIENSDTVSSIISSTLKGEKTTLLFDLNPSSDFLKNEVDSFVEKSYFAQYYKQYGKRSDIVFAINSNFSINPEQFYRISTMYHAPIYTWSTEQPLWSDSIVYENKVMLIDTGLRIINIYEYGDEESMIKLVEHTSITLPSEKNKKYNSSKNEEYGNFN